MKIVKENLLEFHKSGDPLNSLGLGTNIDLFDELLQTKQELRMEIDAIRKNYLHDFSEFVEKALVGKTITARVHEVPRYNKDMSVQLNKGKLIDGKHTFTVQSTFVDEKLITDYHDSSILVADMDNNVYKMHLKQEIIIKK